MTRGKIKIEYVLIFLSVFHFFSALVFQGLETQNLKKAFLYIEQNSNINQGELKNLRGGEQRIARNVNCFQILANKLNLSLF